MFLIIKEKTYTGSEVDKELQESNPYALRNAIEEVHKAGGGLVWIGSKESKGDSPARVVEIDMADAHSAGTRRIGVLIYSTIVSQFLLKLAYAAKEMPISCGFTKNCESIDTLRNYTMANMSSLIVHKPNVHTNVCSLLSASNSCMS